MKKTILGLLALAAILLPISAIPSQDADRGADHMGVDLYFNPEDVKPDIESKRFHNRTEQQYRVNKHLYMIKTVPDNGSPYYLVDPYGSGEWEYRRNISTLDIQVPQWAILRW